MDSKSHPRHRTIPNAFIYVSVFSLFLIACTSAAPSPTAQAELQMDAAALSSSPPATAMPLPTLTPTITPTPTATPYYFVRDGTPVPQPAEAISLENVSQIAELARWGKGSIYDVVYSMDGKNLFVWTPLGMYAYTADTFDLLWFADVPAGAGAVAFAQDQDIFAIGDRDGQITLFSLADGQPIRRWLAYPAEIITLAFSPDAQLLASGHMDNRIIVWNNADQQVLMEFEKQDAIYSKDLLLSLVFSSDGQSLVIQTVNGIIVRSTNDGEILWFLEEQMIGVSPDGSLVALSTRKGVSVFDTANGNEIGVFAYPEDREVSSNSVAFSFDGKMLAVGYDSQIVIDVWRIADGQKLFELKSSEEEEARKGFLAKPVQLSGSGNNTVDNLVFSSDGSMLVSRNGFREVELWRLNDGQLIRSIENSGYGLALSPDDKILVVWDERYIKTFDIDSGIELINSSSFIAGYSVLFSPGGDFFSFGRRMWDLIGNQEIDVTRMHPILNFSPDGQLAYSYLQNSVWVYDVASQALLRQLELEQPEHTFYDITTGIELSPDGNMYAETLWEGGYLFWDLADGSWIPTNDFKMDFPRDFAFSADGSMLAAADWNASSVDLYDVPERIPLVSLPPPEDVTLSTFWQVDFSYDGNTVAAAASDFVIAWELGGDSSRPYILPFDEEEFSIPQLTLSSDGKVIAGSSNGRIYIWQLDGETLLVVLDSHFDNIVDLTFSPDGHFLASASFDGTVRLWGLPKP